MPRYFFDFANGEAAQDDGEGTELPDDKHARDEALDTILAVAKDHGAEGTLLVAVRNEDGAKLFTVCLQIDVTWET